MAYIYVTEHLHAQVLSWIQTLLGTLGVFITKEENLNLNFKLRIAKVTNLVNMWKQRNLSLKGKITIINTLVLATLIYLSSTIDSPAKVSIHRS